MADEHRGQLDLAILDVIQFQEDKKADLGRLFIDFDEYEFSAVDLSETTVRRELARLVEKGDLVKRGREWAITKQGTRRIRGVAKRDIELLKQDRRPGSSLSSFLTGEEFLEDEDRA